LTAAFGATHYERKIMLEATMKQQLKGLLEKLVHPVELSISADDSADSQKMHTLLQEIAELSPSITVVSQPHARTPSFGVARAGETARVRFAGIPLGHEFTSLVLALLQVSGYPPKVSQETIDAIRALNGPLQFETFISLSCHNCPEVVQALNLMAILNPNIEHVMVDGALFQDEVSAKKVMAVPTVFSGDSLFGQGRMNVDEILAKVDTASFAKASAKLGEKDPFDVLVVGAGPSGATAAIYAARKGLRVGIVAERFGGQVADTLGIENFISVKATEGPKLVAALEEHVRDYPVDIIPLQRAAKLLPRQDGLAGVTLESGATLKAKSVIVATGARWRELNVPGEREYRGRGVAYCPHCDGPLFAGRRVAVVGGGNSGVEAAIDLAGIVEHVTLLEFAGALKADAVLQNKLNSLPNVTVVLNAQTREVRGDGEKMTALTYVDRATDAVVSLPLAAVFVQIGLLPNTEWLKDDIELTRFGEIEVDRHGQTSAPGIFAAGDVTTIAYKQIVMAIGDGARAALGAFDWLIRQ
jgi:alkyl hydroperoxide reductase subunit F